MRGRQKDQAITEEKKKRGRKGRTAHLFNDEITQTSVTATERLSGLTSITQHE